MGNDSTFEPGAFEVFFDYLCPFAYNAAVWLHKVEEASGVELPVRWRYFSLEEVNKTLLPDIHVWDEDAGITTKGIIAFRAAEAIRRQDEALFPAFHQGVLNARHRDRLDISDIEVLKSIAVESGADPKRLMVDINDPDIVKGLADDHEYAVEELNVFGTPTFVFAEGTPVYVKLTADGFPDNVVFFNELADIAQNRTQVLEIKRTYSA